MQQLVIKRVRSSLPFVLRGKPSITLKAIGTMCRGNAFLRSSNNSASSLAHMQPHPRAAAIGV